MLGFRRLISYVRPRIRDGEQVQFLCVMEKQILGYLKCIVQSMIR